MKAIDRVAIADGSLVDIACGIEALLRRFDALLERYGDSTDGESGEDSRTLDLVLGLVAIRERWSRELQVSATTNASARSRVEGSWLR
jgi:hypothetical protein